MSRVRKEMQCIKNSDPGSFLHKKTLKMIVGRMVFSLKKHIFWVFVFQNFMGHPCLCCLGDGEISRENHFALPRDRYG